MTHGLSRHPFVVSVNQPLSQILGWPQELFLRPRKKFRDKRALGQVRGTRRLVLALLTSSSGPCTVMEPAWAALFSQQNLGKGSLSTLRLSYSNFLYGDIRTTSQFMCIWVRIWLTIASAVLYEQNFQFHQYSQVNSAGLAVCSERQGGPWSQESGKPCVVMFPGHQLEGRPAGRQLRDLSDLIHCISKLGITIMCVSLILGLFFGGANVQP